MSESGTTNADDGVFCRNSREVNPNGLTKREYFAAMALQGLLSNPTLASTNSEYTVVAVDFSNKLIEQLNK